MSRELPVSYNNIIFPSASSNINLVASELKRNELSIKNRLRSIVQDAAFVEDVANDLQLPLIANERCGSWYIRPEKKTASAYFKSTDGHFGQWSFSLRRLNLQLLSVIREHKGCIIVDSTRRGKSMPDALSKTVPIWIAVLNRLLFPDLQECHSLQTPPEVISQSEHDQIEAKIEKFVVDAHNLKLEVEQLRNALEKPMQPYWITQSAEYDPEMDADMFWPIVLCTSSSRASIHTATDTSYVQGAADDHESWAHGLLPATFWQHKETLLEASEDELPDLIVRCVQLASQSETRRKATLIQPTSKLYITSNASLVEQSADVDAVIYCSSKADHRLQDHLRANRKQFVHLVCGEGKVGSRQLRSELNKLELLGDSISTARVLCSCASGRDLAVGVALAILCKHYTVNGCPHSKDETSTVTVSKDGIKQKLSWIMVSMPDAAPSRATLQSVNTYLMS